MQNWLALSSPFADQTRAQVKWDPDWSCEPGASSATRIASRRTTPSSRTASEFAELPSGVRHDGLLRARPPRGRARRLRHGAGRAWSCAGSTRALRARFAQPERRRLRSTRPPPFDAAATATCASGRSWGWSPTATARSRPRSRTPRVDYDGIHADLVGAGVRELDAARGAQLGSLQAYTDFRFLLEHLTAVEAELGASPRATAADPTPSASATPSRCAPAARGEGALGAPRQPVRRRYRPAKREPTSVSEGRSMRRRGNAYLLATGANSCATGRRPRREAHDATVRTRTYRMLGATGRDRAPERQRSSPAPPIATAVARTRGAPPRLRPQLPPVTGRRPSLYAARRPRRPCWRRHFDCARHADVRLPTAAFVRPVPTPAPAPGESAAAPAAQQPGPGGHDLPQLRADAVRRLGDGRRLDLQPRHGPHLVLPRAQLGAQRLRRRAGLGAGGGVDQRLRVWLRPAEG